MTEVYTWGHVGSGCPMNVWHGLHLTIGSIPLEADPDSVAAWCADHEETIVALAELYEGDHWDGHNNVGSWPESAADACEGLSLALGEEGAIATFWTASDYFAPAQHQVVDDAIAAKSLDAAVEREVDSAASVPALLDPSDVEDELRRLLAVDHEGTLEAAKRAPNSEDCRPLAERARAIRRLLGVTRASEVQS